MIIMGIDPASSKPYAFSAINQEEIFMQGKSDLKGFVSAIKLCKPDLIAIEDQYFSKNYKTAKGLSWSTGKIMGIAEIMNIPYKIINVATWKGYFGLLKKGHIKNNHIEKSVSLGGQNDDDLASSHLIALYTIRNI